MGDEKAGLMAAYSGREMVEKLVSLLVALTVDALVYRWVDQMVYVTVLRKVAQLAHCLALQKDILLDLTME